MTVVGSGGTALLKIYYSRYLKEVRGNRESTVNHYLDALNNISRRLKQSGLVERDIYEMTDVETLKQFRNVLLSDPDFIKLDTTGNRMYSVALNNYIRFMSAEDFIADRTIERLDIPIPPEVQTIGEHETWKRSGLLRKQIIISAGFRCEIDNRHNSFIAEATQKPYMEGHHAIPLNRQPQFPSTSLDIYANIVCLCPICHRQIHFGLKEDRDMMMNKIYDERADRLYNSGIRLSKEEFVGMAG